MRLPGATHRNIYVSSEAAAKRVLESIRRWVEQHLRLEVNAAKSGTGRPWERKFLGFRINRKQQIEAAPESVERFRTKVREIWRSCRGVSSVELRDEWRLRWHSVRGRCRALRRLGVPEQMLRYVPTRRGEWYVAAQRMMHTALPNATLRRYGFVMPSDLAAP